MTTAALETELCFRDQLEVDLYGKPYIVTAEVPMVHGRADLVVWWDSDYPFAIIETKLAFGLAGVGQLLAYSSGLSPRPHLILAVLGEPHPLVAPACKAVDIHLWTPSIGGSSLRDLVASLPDPVFT